MLCCRNAGEVLFCSLARSQFASLQADLDAQSAAAEAAAAEVRRARAFARQVNAEKASLEADRDRLRGLLHEARTASKEQEDSAQKRGGAVSAMRRRLEAVCRARDAATDAQKRAEERAEAAESDVSGLRRRAATAETAKVELATLRAKLQASEGTAAQLKREKEALLEHAEAAEERIAELRERLRKGAASIADAETSERRETALRQERDRALRSASESATAVSSSPLAQASACWDKRPTARLRCPLLPAA